MIRQPAEITMNDNSQMLIPLPFSLCSLPFALSIYKIKDKRKKIKDKKGDMSVLPLP